MNETARNMTPRASLGLAGGIVIGWIGLELLLRWGVVSVLAPTFVSGYAVDWTILLVGFPGMAVVLSLIALRVGQDSDVWGYEWSRRAIAVGLLGVIIAIVFQAVTAQIDAALFGLETTAETNGNPMFETLRGIPLLAVVLLLGNGVAVPIAEEQVWRGIIQTEFVASWGAVVGILLTAVLFALKHVVIDLSLSRVTTLIVLGLVLGVVRHRYRTVSSIITHLGMNLYASSTIVLLAFT